MLGARVDAACKRMMVTWKGERLDGCLENSDSRLAVGHTKRDGWRTGRNGIYDHLRLRLRLSQGGCKGVGSN